VQPEARDRITAAQAASRSLPVRAGTGGVLKETPVPKGPGQAGRYRGREPIGHEAGSDAGSSERDETARDA